MDLKQMLDEIMRSRLQAARTPDARYDGPDWWQLSDDDVAVFELSRARWPALLAVWQAFEYFRERTDGWNDEEIARAYPHADDVMAEARAAMPEWVGGSDDVSVFMKFAAHFAELSHREADAIFAKMHWWAVRVDVMKYGDEEDYPDLSELG